MNFSIPAYMNSNLFNSLRSELKLPSLQQNVFISECNREITFIRDDQIHQVISGNKWRKLNYHMKHFFKNEFHGIASMGGAYSNHLHALSFVCNQLKIPCALFVYGIHGEMNTPTLIDCKNWNAGLHTITRQQAADCRLSGLNSIDESIRSYYWIPEGGGGEKGEMGMKDLIAELPVDFDQKENLIICASGTGTTIQGILNYSSNCTIATRLVVKMANYPWRNHERVKWFASSDVVPFANGNHELKEFMIRFLIAYDIQLDKVYTGPLMQSFLNDKRFYNFQKIFFIHSGGLQGNREK
jgi:1-aminocyclopropane-1-carboxylate deaminase